jgi:hypothetical protein
MGGLLPPKIMATSLSYKQAPLYCSPRFLGSDHLMEEPAIPLQASMAGLAFYRRTLNSENSRSLISLSFLK